MLGTPDGGLLLGFNDAVIGQIYIVMTEKQLLLSGLPPIMFNI